MHNSDHHKINRRTITKCRVYDEKYRCWDTSPLMIYPGEPIVKQGRIIQWWTGLIDINKKEIYEGDIVRKLMSRSLWDVPEYDRGVITWVRESFCINQKNIGSTNISEYVSCDCCSTDLNVIGNIFDNPELLLDTV